MGVGRTTDGAVGAAPDLRSNHEAGAAEREPRVIAETAQEEHTARAAALRWRLDVAGGREGDRGRNDA